MRKRFIVLIAAFFLALVTGFWMGSKSLYDQLPEKKRMASNSIAERGDWGAAIRHRRPLPQSADADEAAEQAGAFSNQRVLVFKDAKSLEDFLSRQGDRVILLGAIGQLNAVRVAFPDVASMMAALGSEDQQGLVFPVSVPTLGEGSVQAGAVSMGHYLLQWLGVDGPNPDWGQGVKIAVLDTGVVPGEGLGKVSRFIELVPTSSDLDLQHGHGTAVASMIVGQSAKAPGVAPAAEMLSVRVANDEGQSDSFLLAQGIVEATDAGAQLINISLGGFGDSQVLRDAVDYAMARGALVIASVGNNGVERVHFPAAIEGVIGVGAVDAMGSHLDFSNSGEGVDLAAPGYGLAALGAHGESLLVSGTSFSAPIVTGALAAIMTEGSGQRLSPIQAWELMAEYLNDGGYAGVDAQLGAGMPDLGRVLMRETPGIYDAAVASLSLLQADAGHPYGQVEVLVQNRGTETLLNTGLTIESGGVSHRVNLTALKPGEVQPVKVPVTQNLTPNAQGFQVDSQVRLGNGQQDAKPENDRRDVSYSRLGDE